MSKKEKFSMRITVGNTNIEFNHKEQVYHFVGALTSKRPVDGCEIKYGSLIVSKEVERIFVITHPTSKMKGQISNIIITKKQMKKFAKDVVNAALNSGQFDED